MAIGASTEMVGWFKSTAKEEDNHFLLPGKPYKVCKHMQQGLIFQANIWVGWKMRTVTYSSLWEMFTGKSQCGPMEQML